MDLNFNMNSVAYCIYTFLTFNTNDLSWNVFLRFWEPVLIYQNGIIMVVYNVIVYMNRQGVKLRSHKKFRYVQNLMF